MSSSLRLTLVFLIFLPMARADFGWKHLATLFWSDLLRIKVNDLEAND